MKAMGESVLRPWLWNRAKIMAAYQRITPPYDGVITKRSFHIGEISGRLGHGGSERGRLLAPGHRAPAAPSPRVSLRISLVLRSRRLCPFCGGDVA